ncbi:hypothetical protein [Pseudoalteromonas sp. MMG005]|nr:hypothetical protein [Pseudoalteromonas sp. MMG005]MBQ4845238.1 hypothetical protein [Pseudoalteromonas sp. MMG005]
MKATPRVRKIALLDQFAYPELGLGAVDLSGSFLQQFDWLLYKAEAA